MVIIPGKLYRLQTFYTTKIDSTRHLYFYRYSKYGIGWPEEVETVAHATVLALETINEYPSSWLKPDDDFFKVLYKDKIINVRIREVLHQW